MAKYNGHKNYNYWNVSLWIHNDEGLYNLARDCVKMGGRNKTNAAELFLQAMNMMDMPMTPDGVKWSASSVKAAMGEM